MLNEEERMEILRQEQASSYIAQFYIGQTNEEVIQGDLKLPPANFEFMRNQSKRKPHSLFKRTRVGHPEESKAGRAPAVITPEEMNTPMFCALQESGSRGNKPYYLKSVHHQQAGLAFWLGYLYKKLSQSNAEALVRTLNEKGVAELTAQRKQLGKQIENQFPREAQRWRQLQDARAAGQRLPSREELLERERRENINRELAGYQVEEYAGLLSEQARRQPEYSNVPIARREQLRHLWDDETSIFQYQRDVHSVVEVREEILEMGEERTLEQINNIMDQKWQRMDRYWFQKNRHLDRKMRPRNHNQAPPAPQAMMPPTHAPQRAAN